MSNLIIFDRYQNKYFVKLEDGSIKNVNHDIESFMAETQTFIDLEGVKISDIPKFVRDKNSTLAKARVAVYTYKEDCNIYDASLFHKKGLPESIRFELINTILPKIKKDTVIDIFFFNRADEFLSSQKIQILV